MSSVDAAIVATSDHVDHKREVIASIVHDALLLRYGAALTLEILRKEDVVYAHFREGERGKGRGRGKERR